MRELLPIGALLLAGVLAHAQEAPAPTGSTGNLSSYRFDGQLVYRTRDGAFVPLLPDAVFLGWGDKGCRLTDQSSERLNFYPDRIFQLSILPRVTFTSGWKGDTPSDSSRKQAA